MQDPTTRQIGDLIPTIGGSGAHPWRGFFLEECIVYLQRNLGYSAVITAAIMKLSVSTGTSTVPDSKHILQTVCVCVYTSNSVCVCVNIEAHGSKTM